MCVFHRRLILFKWHQFRLLTNILYTVGLPIVYSSAVILSYLITYIFYSSISIFCHNFLLYWRWQITSKMRLKVAIYILKSQNNEQFLFWHYTETTLFPFPPPIKLWCATSSSRTTRSEKYGQWFITNSRHFKLLCSSYGDKMYKNRGSTDWNNQTISGSMTWKCIHIKQTRTHAHILFHCFTVHDFSFQIIMWREQVSAILHTSYKYQDPLGMPY